MLLESFFLRRSYFNHWYQLLHPHIAGSMPFRFFWATLYISHRKMGTYPYRVYSIEAYNGSIVLCNINGKSWYQSVHRSYDKLFAEPRGDDLQSTRLNTNSPSHRPDTPTRGALHHPLCNHNVIPIAAYHLSHTSRVKPFLAPTEIARGVCYN